MTLYIAIEGPIGVGKSSLTRRLAETLQFDTLYEIVEANPFLSDFYDDIDQWSFQTEMFFLCNRYKQINDLGNRAVVSDYHIMKNKIFARNSLQPKEYHKFEQIYDVLTEDLRMPDITIFLTAELPVLRQRIQMRNRVFESTISDDYLLKLTEDYQHIANQMDDSNHLLIDTTHIDFVNHEEDYQRIVDQIKQLIGAQHV